MRLADFVWTGDVHLYNHLEQAELQLSRAPRPLPTLNIHRRPDSLYTYQFEDFEITGYEPHPHIKAPVAVNDAPFDYLDRCACSQWCD